MSERDAELLLLIGEQYAITVDQLARLIGRTYRTARWLRDRWQQAGWVASRQLVAGGPSLFWLTRQGSRVAQSPYRTWDANPGIAAHIEAVTEMRLLLERQLRLGEWQCERMLAKTYGPRSDTRRAPAGCRARSRSSADRDRGRADTEEPRAARGDRARPGRALPAGLVLRRRHSLCPTLSEVAAGARWQNVQRASLPAAARRAAADGVNGPSSPPERGPRRARRNSSCCSRRRGRRRWTASRSPPGLLLAVLRDQLATRMACFG